MSCALLSCAVLLQRAFVGAVLSARFCLALFCRVTLLYYKCKHHCDWLSWDCHAAHPSHSIWQTPRPSRLAEFFWPQPGTRSKCPRSKCPGQNVPVRMSLVRTSQVKMSLPGTFWLGTFWPGTPWSECPQSKCPQSKCPHSKCPQSKCPSQNVPSQNVPVKMSRTKCPSQNVPVRMSTSKIIKRELLTLGRPGGIPTGKSAFIYLLLGTENTFWHMWHHLDAATWHMSWRQMSMTTDENAVVLPLYVYRDIFQSIFVIKQWIWIRL